MIEYPGRATCLPAGRRHPALSNLFFQDHINKLSIGGRKSEVWGQMSEGVITVEMNSLNWKNCELYVFSTFRRYPTSYFLPLTSEF